VLDWPIETVVPVRNGARFIAPAIESALAQTLPPQRVIVVDDGSTDDSAEIAESFGDSVTVLRRPPRGGPAALNEGLAESDAPLIAFLDADDLWLPHRLEWQAEVLAEQPEVDLVFGHVTEFLDGNVENIVARAEPQPGILKSALLARRSAFERVGDFDTGYGVVDFPEWHARAQAAGIGQYVVPEVVARRRVHGENTTILRREALNAEYLRMARAALLRRRTAAAAAQA
jgi:glycosyltransferase involved in cell wall biosynthesis